MHKGTSMKKGNFTHRGPSETRKGSGRLYSMAVFGEILYRRGRGEKPRRVDRNSCGLICGGLFHGVLSQRKQENSAESAKNRPHPRNKGRVRQVGPPLPLMQISLPGKVR